MLPRKSLKKRKNWLKWLFLFGLILFFGLLFFVLTKVLVVKNLDCRLQESSCPSQTKEILQQAFYGKSLFLPKKEIDKVLAVSLGEFEVISFKRDFFKLGFNFDLTLGKIVAALKADRYYLLDSNGYVLKVSDGSEDWPVLNSSWQSLGLKKGDKFPQEEVHKGLLVLTDLSLLGLRVKEAAFKDGGLEVIQKDLATIIFFSLSDELSSQVNSLQLILNRAKMEGKVFKKIDLRFEKPIVTFYE